VSTEACDPYDGYEDEDTYGDVCSDAIDEWIVLADDGLTTVSVVGNLLEAGDEDWYRFDASQTARTSGYNTYHFEVNLLEGSADYAFEVYQGSCATADQECPTGSGEFTQYEDYAEDTTTGQSYHLFASDLRYCRNSSRYNTCDDLGDTYYVHVVHTSGSYSCANYELEVTNGVW
jgi:hypothetical protein